MSTPGGALVEPIGHIVTRAVMAQLPPQLIPLVHAEFEADPFYLRANIRITQTRLDGSKREWRSALLPGTPAGHKGRPIPCILPTEFVALLCLEVTP